MPYRAASAGIESSSDLLSFVYGAPSRNLVLLFDELVGGGVPGRVQLHTACMENEHMVTLLLEIARIKSHKDTKLNELLEWKRKLFEARDEDGRTPIHLAMVYNNAQAVQTLLEHEAKDSGIVLSPDTRTQWYSHFLNAVSEKNEHPFVMAVKYGNIKTIKTVLKLRATLPYPFELGLGSNPEEGCQKYFTHLCQLRDRKNDSTCLQLAVEPRRLPMVEWLVDIGNMDVNHQNKRGHTAMMTACVPVDRCSAGLLSVIVQANVTLLNTIEQPASIKAFANGNTEIVELLLATEKVDINLQDNEGKSALFKACSIGSNTEAVKLLLATKKVDVNLQDDIGETALTEACSNGNTEVVKLLLKMEQVDVNLQNHNGSTPLHIACLHGRTETIKLLLTIEQVIVNLQDHWGDTPLSIACVKGDAKIVKLLLDTGKIDLKSLTDEHGKTARSVASERDCNVIVALLDEHFGPEAFPVSENKERTMYLRTRKTLYT